MKPVRRILFAVKDPAAQRESAALQGITLAKALGAQIEFFHSISTPVFLDLQPLTNVSLDDLKREALAARREGLEKLVSLARRKGVRATGYAEWDYPPHEAILRRAEKNRADLIVAELHQGSRAKRWIMKLNDWELLRASVVPVLLLKEGAPTLARAPVLAAIDPSHAHAKPSALDVNILGAAQRIAEGLGGKLHIVHSVPPGFYGLPTGGDPAIDAQMLAARQEVIRERRRKDLDRFAARAEVPASRRHLVDGEPDAAIPRVAKKIDAGLVVMGAVSRSGLKRLFIGNTAERVLEELPCDVLVVHPKRSKARLPAKPRGMKVVTTTPLLPVA